MHVRRFASFGFLAWAGCAMLLPARALTQTPGANAAVEVRVSSRFDIPAQDLGTALTLFGRQSDREIVFSPEVTRAKKAPTVVGEMPSLRALENILAGSGLTYKVTDDGTIVVLIPEAVGQNRSTQRAGLWNLANAGGKTADSRTSRRVRMQIARAVEEKAADARSAGKGRAQASGAVPEILVRGQKIDTLNMDIRRSRDDAQPYVIFEREDIRRSGASDLNEFLKQRLTMNTVSRSNHQGPGSTGNTSSINLRGLGSSQTLILIDGHRVATPVTGGSIMFQPDINGVPLAAVERIEILPASASAIYGGSATGGVVNVILRRDYSGAEVNLTYDNTFDTDSAIRRADLSAGLNFNAGRSNLLLAASVLDNRGLRLGDRNFVQRGRAAILANNPGALLNASSPPLGATPNIRSSNGSPLFGPGTPNFTSVPVGYAGGGGLAPLQANAGQYNLELPDSSQSAGARRSLLNEPGIESLRLTLRHEFSENLRAFLELSASSNSGRFVWSQSAETFTLLAGAPNNPFGQNVRVTAPLDEIESIFRTANRDRRVVGGIIMRLPADWAMEADYTWSRFTVSSSQGAFLNGGEATDIAIGTQDILRDTLALPLDLSQFVGDAPAAMTTPADFTLRNTTVRVAGPLGTLPAGRPQVSVLLEHRDEHFGEIVQIYGFLPDFPFTYPEKSQSVKSAYAELKLPVVSAANSWPGVQEFDLQFALRHDDYTTKGATNDVLPGDAIDRRTNRNQSTNPTIGLRYKPVPDIMLRASYATGFLPPSVQDVVPSPVSVFPGPAFADPRRGNEPLGAFEFISGGSTELQPEDSKTRTAGVVFTPRAIPGLRLSIDYTRIEKTDNITSFGFQQLIDNENVLSGRVVRDNPQPGDPFGVGPIVFLDLTLANIARAEIKAYDLALDYSWDTARYGMFELFAQSTWQTLYATQITPNQPAVNNVGISAFNPLKFKANAGLVWTLREWTVGAAGRYFDDYRVSSNPSVVMSQGSQRVASQQYYDLFAARRFAGRSLSGGFSGMLADSEIRVGIKNVFNTRPPLDMANSFYSPYGDPRLASYYLTFTKGFVFQ